MLIFNWATRFSDLSKLFDVLVLPLVFIVSFYLQFKLVFAQWFVLDKGIGVFEGIKRSFYFFISKSNFRRKSHLERFFLL